MKGSAVIFESCGGIRTVERGLVNPGENVCCPHGHGIRRRVWDLVPGGVVHRGMAHSHDSVPGISLGLENYLKVRVMHLERG